VSRRKLDCIVAKRNVGLFYFVLLSKSARTNRQKYGVPPCVSRITLYCNNITKRKVGLFQFVLLGNLVGTNRQKYGVPPVCHEVNLIATWQSEISGYFNSFCWANQSEQTYRNIGYPPVCHEGNLIASWQSEMSGYFTSFC